MAITPESAKARFDAETERFGRLMGDSGDLLHVLLKGHLLIEEQLSQIARATLAEPDYLDDARLTFAQLLRLSKAAAGQFFPTDVYEAIRKLGAIRNQVAHRAEPGDLAEVVSTFLDWCRRQPRLSRTQQSPSPSADLLHALSIVWGRLAGQRDALEVLREHRIPPWAGDDEKA